MAKSLQSCIPKIAEILGEKPTTLYERQRALVRAGLLTSMPGRGRGSGVQATFDSVAILLVGVVASISLAEAAPKARMLLKAPSLGSVCRLTGAKTFRAALIAVLEKPELGKRVTDITVQVSGVASIGFDGSNSSLGMDYVLLKHSLEGSGAKNVRLSPEPSVSVFGSKNDQGDGLRVRVSIPPATVQSLCTIVRSLLSDQGATS